MITQPFQLGQKFSSRTIHRELRYEYLMLCCCEVQYYYQLPDEPGAVNHIVTQVGYIAESYNSKVFNRTTWTSRLLFLTYCSTNH